MSNHTPLPWKHTQLVNLGDLVETEVNYITDQDDYVIADTDASFIDQTLNIANAEFIARACNNHYGLIEVLKEGCRAFESLVEQFKANYGDSGFEYEHNCIRDMKEILAKAEGE